MTVRDIGLGIVRRAAWLEPGARAIYRRLPAALQDTPTDLLSRVCSELNEVRFIQIGAFDGIAGDPIRPKVTADKRWRGVLVEPQPSVFARLQTNYKDHADRLTLINCAVSAEEGQLPFYVIPADEVRRLGLPGWAEEVASFDSEHLRRHFPTARVESMPIPVRTVASICAEFGYSGFDVVVMDVEGHERVIIDSIDWQKLGVRACMFEHKHMAAEDLADTDAQFKAAGFAIKRYGRDTVAYRMAASRP